MLKSLVFRLLITSLVVIGVQNIALADTVSLDSNYVAGQTQITDKLNADRLALTNGVNNIRGVYAGGVQSSGQIKADTVGEENMYDDANPRIRTAEGASCSNMVYSGLLPVTSSSLVGNIPAGIAYPAGYRIEKTDSTAKTFTASKWTWCYLCSTGSFDYQEAAIDGSSPATPANCAPLARVSTDATMIIDVADLRTTNCAAGPFDAISDAAQQANLDDLLSNGSPGKKSASYGWVQGLQVSYDTYTSFKVKRGSAYINGKYRAVSADVTVPNTADAPSTGISGVDTAVAASTTYNVFAVADQDSVKTLSITYDSDSTPTGVTNYRLIGKVRTDSDSHFVSEDMVATHSITGSEYVRSWAVYETAGAAIKGSRNVSSISDDAGAGLNTITWDTDFTSRDYAVVAQTLTNGATDARTTFINTITAGTVSVQVDSGAGTGKDTARVYVIAVGGEGV